MARPYEFVPQETLEKRADDLASKIHNYAMDGLYVISAPQRRELRKVNKELRFRHRWEIKTHPSKWNDAYDYNAR